jgi:hypothetical protein
MKIYLVGAEELNCSMRTDGQTDRHDEAESHILQFVNMPEMFFLNKTPEISLILKIIHMKSKKPILH